VKCCELIEKFCADPKDFVSPSQIVQMATFFGFRKTELKKVRSMAEKEESSREDESHSVLV